LMENDLAWQDFEKWNVGTIMKTTFKLLTNSQLTL
jgi:hypothetical protein